MTCHRGIAKLTWVVRITISSWSTKVSLLRDVLFVWFDFSFPKTHCFLLLPVQVNQETVGQFRTVLFVVLRQKALLCSPS